MLPYPRTWVEIDLPALAHNLGWLRDRLGPDGPRIALVAKADAYGHGLTPIARHALAHGADWIAVATVQEGIALRDAGIVAPVIVLSPILDVEAGQAVFYDLRVSVEDIETVRALSAAAVDQGATSRVHLKVDTGLNRFGCRPEDAAALALAIQAQPGVELEGISTHYADSARDPDGTERQLALFGETLAACASQGITFQVRHTANSAAAVLRPAPECNMVRVGIAAYGVDPYGLAGGELRPVMSWHARVMAIRERPPGVKIGYSGTYTTGRPTRIATLGVGYGDGYPKTLSNLGVVEFAGREAPVIGLVCMDQTMVDATDLEGVEVGAAMRLIGGSVHVARLAELARTNAHEIVTRIMSRVPRRYLRG